MVTFSKICVVDNPACNPLTTSVLMLPDIVLIIELSNNCSLSAANVDNALGFISANPIVDSKTPLCALAYIDVAFCSLFLSVPSTSIDNKVLANSVISPIS